MLTFQITIFTFTTGSPITPTDIQKRKYIKIGHFRNVSLMIYIIVKTLRERKHMVHRIYPAELQLNKANASDTEAVFLDLNLSIHNDIVSTKIYDL